MLSAWVWRAQASPVPEEEPPSSALASVVQHLPLELMDGVVRNLSNDDSVTDSQMLTAISRWVLRLVDVGGLVPHFSLKLLWVGGLRLSAVRGQALIPICSSVSSTVLLCLALG